MSAPSLAHGVWFTPRRIVIAVVDATGYVCAETVLKREAEARRVLVDGLAVIRGAELVLRGGDIDPLGTLAMERRVPVWLVEAGFVDGIRRAAGMRATPRRLAGLIARLPSIGYPWVHTMMRRHP